MRMNLRYDVRLLDDSADLVKHGLAHDNLLPDHGVVLVVGVVRIAQLTRAGKLELHEFVPELTLMTHTASRVSRRGFGAKRKVFIYLFLLTTPHHTI